MKESHFEPDDHRLTAFALGELSAGTDLVAVERYLAESSDARAALSDIQFVTALLVMEYRDELANVPAPTLTRERSYFPRERRTIRFWGHPLLEMAAILLILGGSGTWLFRGILTKVNRRPSPATVEVGFALPSAAETCLSPASPGFVAVNRNSISTFPLNIGTACYTSVRRCIEAGALPPPNAVRIEELLNAFPSVDAPPANDSPEPFAVHFEAAACPWKMDHRLIRIGIKGREANGEHPASIAHGVKIQVEFNPAAAIFYRLIGYERQSAENDTGTAAGAAGQTVVALYEVVPVQDGNAATMFTLNMRYKLAATDANERSLEQAFTDHPAADDLANASPDYKFATSVAWFGLALKAEPEIGPVDPAGIVELASQGRGDDVHGDRTQFVDLVRKAAALMNHT